MADYYCSASVMIPYRTKEEQHWLLTELGKASGNLCAACQHDEELCTCTQFQRVGDPGGFDFQDQDTSGFWVYGDEAFNGDVLVDVVQRYQIEFNRTDFWQLEAAYTCSKLRLDGFGGYGVLVYEGDAYWFHPTQLIEAKIKELKERT